MVSEHDQLSIKKEVDSSSYARWPFRAERVSANGDRNNGGINLIAHPEMIDLIHEATDENGLRNLLISINKPDRAFMSLGCLAGESGGFYYTYVEFTPRNDLLARDEGAIKAIHSQWLTWTSKTCSDYPGLADALLQNVEWTYREFSFRETEPQFLITIYARARSAQDHGNLISWVHNFLCQVEMENAPH